MSQHLSKNLDENIAAAAAFFPIGISFDIVTRNLNLGTTRAFWIGINGFCRNELLQELFSHLQNPLYTANSVIENLKNYMNSKIGYSQAELVRDWDTVSKQIFSGASALLVDGFDECMIIDTRTYPVRSISEPDTEKVTRGPRDGFVETIVFNTALIRRHIRNPKLTFEIKTVGEDSKTDIAVGYIHGKADEVMLEQIRSFLDHLNITALTVGAKSLEELLVPKNYLHPLPSFFTTERPDVACSYLSEGHILLIVDNSPAVLILPCTFFQFTQNPEDYYKSPIVGNYIRFLRFFALLGSLFLLPLLFVAKLNSPVDTSGPLSCFKLLLNILFMEIGLDIFRYASSHTTSRFSAALSIVGGLVLSDSAVKLGFMSFEILFYGAITLLLTLCLTGIELGEGIRIYRIFLVLGTALGAILGSVIGMISKIIMNLISVHSLDQLYLFFTSIQPEAAFLQAGAVAGLITSLTLAVISMATTPTFGHTSYLWPLYPFHKKALKTLLFRYPTQMAQPVTPCSPKAESSHEQHR